MHTSSLHHILIPWTIIFNGLRMCCIVLNDGARDRKFVRRLLARGRGLGDESL